VVDGKALKCARIGDVCVGFETGLTKRRLEVDIEPSIAAKHDPSAVVTGNVDDFFRASTPVILYR
jgi:hypothetical protein